MPSSLPSTRKKPRISKPGNEVGSSKNGAQKVIELEMSISDALSKNASLNALADLFQIANTMDDDDILVKAMFALYRSFTLIAQKGILTRMGKGADEGVEPGRRSVRSWVIARLDAFTELLSESLQNKNKIIRTSSLRILFSLLRQLSSIIQEDEASTPLRFDVAYFQKIVRAVLLCHPSSRQTSIGLATSGHHTETASDIQELLLETWLNQYTDIRWFFLRETALLLEDSNVTVQNPLLPASVLSILERLKGMPHAGSTASFVPASFWIEGVSNKPRKKNASQRTEEEVDDINDEGQDDWRKFFDGPKPASEGIKGKSKASRIYTLSVRAQLHNIAAHRAVFTRCWLALLPFLSRGGEVFVRGADEELEYAEQGDLVLVSRALVILHHGVLPHLTRPVLIMDWVSSCVDYGGHVGLLALNALFILMREYNLDYPSFYTRLYAFFTRDVLHLRYRARFFRLAELFLSSTHLPAALLASFIKRMARLSLFAPPAGVIIVIPFTYNVLKRHPALMCMIHRPEMGGIEDELDPFDPEEKDPMQTKALQSSLWELTTHRQHYHASVATLARVFEEAFTRPGFAMEDFLDHTYTTLFETETKRRIRKEPPVLDSELAKPIVIRVSNAADDAAVQSDVVSLLWRF